MDNELDNTLMLGNGFVQSLYSASTDWKSLYDDEHNKILEYPDYTFLYEMYLIRNHQSDNQYKRVIADKLRSYTGVNSIKKNALEVDSFGKYLQEHSIRNIITTNYDKGIENILCYRNGYEEVWPKHFDKDKGEKIYSIRRNTLLKKDDNEIRIWKIHGDIDNLASISLGFDQYCGSIAKIDSYLKGKYTSSTYEAGKVNSMEEKCRNSEYSNISWIDLFFDSNVYIAGFGLDFSEIDIWWLINRRCRFIKQGILLKNRIVFLYNKYDTGEADENDKKAAEERKALFNKKISTLEIFGVECRKIETGERYIPSLFKEIY